MCTSLHIFMASVSTYVISVHFLSDTYYMYGIGTGICLDLNIIIFWTLPFPSKTIKLNKHSAELQQTDPSTKVKGEFSTKNRIFQPNAHMFLFYYCTLK